MGGSVALTSDWLSEWPIFVWVGLAALLGLVLGSFAGLVVYRLPRMVLGQSRDNLSYPASHCGSCGQTLRWWHNVPVLSYVGLRGRCAFCGAPIGRLNLYTELALAALWAGMVALKGPGPSAVAWAGFFSVLLVLLLIDWQTLLLPDVLTLPLIVAGVGCAYLGWIGLDWVEALLAATLGYWLLRLTAWVFERLRGVAGMGGGDPKLMAALGAWLGLQPLVWVLLWSSVLHALWAWVSQRRADATSVPDASAHEDDDVPAGAVPFGPALVLAAVLVWATSAGAQSIANYPFKVQAVQNGEVMDVVAINDGGAVVSTEVHLQGRNMVSDRALPIYAAVPPRSSVVLAHAYAVEPGQNFEVGIRLSRAFGDLNAPVDTAPYRLPFQNGHRFEISQAFGATLTTHQSPNLQQAVDFDMPEGTPVVAARAGQVVEVQTGFTEGGPDPQLAERANLVRVLHDDGSLATYAHLAPRAVAVSVGQSVQVGQVLGYSGNTGYSSGPHLHFCVSKPVVSAQGMTEACMPVRFVTGVPPQVFTPQEGVMVQANDEGPADLRWSKHAMDQRLTSKTTEANMGAALADFSVAGVRPLSLLSWLLELPLWMWLAVSVLLLFGLTRAMR